MRRSLTPLLLFLLMLANTITLADTHLLTENMDQERQDAFDARQGQYQPRTKHLCNAQPCYTNRLIHENSPYLLQHAHNPIDWFSWGEAAFEKAKKENKPIFLSIGYAACHWCHVMEEESFDDREIATLLNEYFVAIKVDREQRPDIDEFYAHAVMYFQGIQGWPMSVFLTPAGQAFFGGGYYTREQFKELLISKKDEWRDQQAHVIKKSQHVLEQLQTNRNETLHASSLGGKIRMQAITDILSMQDIDYGGFGEASKFPREPWLLLLLDDSFNNLSSEHSYTALTNTLTHIARGGIHDHLSGGFFRYTTDQFWKVPHFEKMLYSQALLSILYLQTSIIQPNNEYTTVAEQTLNFMLQSMQAPDGGFYASLDADTAEGEGHYYIWYEDQFKSALNTREMKLADQYYNMDKHGEMNDGGNILYTTLSLEDFAVSNHTSIQTMRKKIDMINNELLAVRANRTPPALDKKIIMSWNGMAIIALVNGAQVLNKHIYLERAKQTADFIWNNMRDDQGFYRVHIQGSREQTAHLEDYAWYLNALIKLYDADDNIKWLDRAEIIATLMKSGFLDKKNGGLFQTAEADKNFLPLRPKTAIDKTLPSANATASQGLTRLARRTGKNEYRILAENILSSFATETRGNPIAYSGLLIASQEFHHQENNLPLFAARGNIRVNAKMSALTDNLYSLDIELKIRDTWHINSSQPLDKQLIATNIKMSETSDWILETVQYPKDKVAILGFSKEPLSLYERNVRIHATLLKGKTTRNPRLQLNLQACNDQICLPPEQLEFIPVPGNL